ncbi:MAG: T9SS type A sorting domain-containing protein [Calditrichaeota bacterium]|nr:T9SS type A sorting domain-containing protein [Calditrichota bacterium]
MAKGPRLCALALLWLALNAADTSGMAAPPDEPKIWREVLLPAHRTASYQPEARRADEGAVPTCPGLGTEAQPQVEAALLPTSALDGLSDAEDDSVFLDLLQRTAFTFFWNEANPTTGLIRDSSLPNSPCSIASLGFGLTAICIAIDRGWVRRDLGRSRVLAALKTLWTAPQGKAAQGVSGYKGFFYHFLDINTALRTWDCELSSIDTALLLAGVLYAREYFAGADSLDCLVRSLADSIYLRVDWNWMRNYAPGLMMGYYPETGFINAWWRGYNEAMIMYILALGSPTHPVPSSVWSAWTSGYSWETHYGYSYVAFPPLFGHQYSHCWIDFRDISDPYMRAKGITYFENSRRATLAARAYCIANPKGFVGYGENIWGITACDGPTGYLARGAPPPFNDDGTIAPTAAGGSMPFTPQHSLAALRHLYDNYRMRLWGEYGFRDAFNLTLNWWSSCVIGIDQGPIIVMIENYRSGKVWRVFMQNPYVQEGLARAGFVPFTGVGEEPCGVPRQVRLYQNYPNPCNTSTVIGFELPQPTWVKLVVYDALGRVVGTLVDEPRAAGQHVVRFVPPGDASGVYLYRLQTAGLSATKKMVIAK